MNKSPCSSRCGLAAMQRGYSHRLHRSYCCLFLGRSGLYPGGRRRALGCGPIGTLPSLRGHARRYSSCHCNVMQCNVFASMRNAHCRSAVTVALGPAKPGPGKPAKTLEPLGNPAKNWLLETPRNQGFPARNPNYRLALGPLVW